MKKALLVSLIIIILTALIIINSIISYNNNLRVLELKISNLNNTITIEEEEIISIQEKLKNLVDEYTDYEKETNELVVENINPQIVLNMYPELKSSNMYNNLSRQYLKSMRNIKDSKREYNKAVEEYNSLLVTLKGRILSGGKSLLEYKK